MRILVLQHLDVEHPGIFRDLWTEAGHVRDTVEIDAGEVIPPLEGYDLMVAMGGPMDVWEEDEHPWLVAEKAAIKRWVLDLDRPFLGICLGHQLLAASLGGTVGPMRYPEVGLTKVELTREGAHDPLLDGLGAEIETFQWHGAEVSALPPGAVKLAGNAACAIQALRAGRHAYGVQFHCEMTETTVADWKDIPAYARSLQEGLGIERAARLDEEVAEKLPGFQAIARRLSENLAQIVDGPKRA